MLRVETQIHLNKFQPRWYQKPIFDAIENQRYKKAVLIWPRRSGKDIAVFNLAIRAALMKPQIIYYIFPEYSQGKKALFETLTNDGMRVIDYIPKEMIANKNEQELKIRFKNNSILQVVGSANFNSLRGTNVSLAIFSEYAYQDPRAYSLIIKPIVNGNGGTCIFLSTPYGNNHFYNLFEIAKDNPKEWYCDFLTIEDTQHIPLEEIEKDITEGLISRDMAMQEYWCSFTAGVEGSYYSKYLNAMKLNNQIGPCPWEPSYPVYTAWDLGHLDKSVIIFFQKVGQQIRIIDYYEKNKEALSHYVNVVLSKEYTYAKHFGPHDIRVHDLSLGLTRWEVARQLGVTFTVAPQIEVEDGIESVRATLPRVWIDNIKCAPLIKALESYRQEWDSKLEKYKGKPLHNWACFTAETLLLTRNGMRQIIDITEKDEVLTLSGWKSCMKSKKSGKNATLVEVIFTDGTKVKCTPEHLFLTTKGWKSAKDLQTNTKILSGSTNLLSTLMGSCFVYGQMRGILLQAEKAYIDRLGKKLLDQFHLVVTYITETMIPLTTISGISSVYQRLSILNFRDQITRDFLMLLAIKQVNGIDQMLEDYGIKGMLKDQLPGLNGNDEQNSAYIVNGTLRALYDEMGMSKNFVTRTAKHLTIAKVNSLKERADVYDIYVPGIHHFSLSNGAIVHNSDAADAMRYLCISLPKTRDNLSSDELDRRYREVYSGNDFPAPFSDNYNYSGKF